MIIKESCGCCWHFYLFNYPILAWKDRHICMGSSFWPHKWFKTLLLAIKYSLIFILLSKKERSSLAAIVKENVEYSIDNYAMAMGETYKEFIDLLLEWEYRIS